MRNCPALAILAGLAVAVLPGAGNAQHDDLVLRGAWEYREACAVCHGKHGTGDSTMREILKMPPPDLTKLSERNGGIFPFERVLRVIDGRIPVEGHGSADMPVWGRTFRRDLPTGAGSALFGGDPELVVAGRIYALAKYLRAIQGGREIPLVEPERPRRHWPREIPIWPDLE